MIGERLLDLRKDAGLTQDELADILKINKHSISSYERDKSEPPDAIKIEIARYFGVSVDYLLGLTNDCFPHTSHRLVLRLSPLLNDCDIRSIKDYVDYLVSRHSKKE